ncbi:conjugal transfer protein TraI [Mesorhizobium sp. WSM3864]|uniref:acyl-homoserine-lactone synthase n=1 Tax=Mesorhizobium sp. WSM3864 TaxID=2029404 RepID=UPI000BAE9742|nr:acyl-homoserine-lactone synthase [Mesorhizobium sp. WSM3864]PBB89229.1 conjugal transfer protein TraI [Mesorhizobium sp. WSM3864]
MLQLIAPEWYGDFADALRAMHRQRHRVFKQRLDWEVETSGGYELDAFDAQKPHYLVLPGASGEVCGCVRLLASTGPTMLGDSFPLLLRGKPAPRDPRTWESSRFALDLPPSAAKGAGGIGLATYKLFAGMIEFGRWRKLERIVTVTDLRMERILGRVGWPPERLGEPHTIGNTRAVAEYLDVSANRLDGVRRNGGFGGPVL